MLSKFDVVGAPASRVPPSAPSTAGPHPIAPPLSHRSRLTGAAGTTQRFDETLLLAADMVGLPVLAYKYNRPKAKGGFRGGKADICPDMEV